MEGVKLLKCLLPGFLRYEDSGTIHQQYPAVWHLENFESVVNSGYLLGWVGMVHLRQFVLVAYCLEVGLIIFISLCHIN